MKIRAGSQWREILTGKAYINGAWRTLAIGKAYVGGAWRDIADFVAPLSLEITPSFGAWTGTSTVTTGAHTATPTGGLAPFTYAWVKLSGDAISITSPTHAVTTFSGNVDSGDLTAVFRCTVTDSLGTTATDDLNMSIALRGDLGSE